MMNSTLDFVEFGELLSDAGIRFDKLAKLFFCTHRIHSWCGFP